jgi:hypothetical protein
VSWNALGAQQGPKISQIILLALLPVFSIRPGRHNTCQGVYVTLSIGMVLVADLSQRQARWFKRRFQSALSSGDQD